MFCEITHNAHLIAFEVEHQQIFKLDKVDNTVKNRSEKGSSKRGIRIQNKQEWMKMPKGIVHSLSIINSMNYHHGV